jgi:hypothetical protein
MPKKPAARSLRVSASPRLRVAPSRPLAPSPPRPLISTVLPLLLLTGCGYIGEPLPPLMHIPARVTDLAAVQRGSNLIVQFAVPTVTTESTLIKQAVRLDLRIGPISGTTFNPDAWAAGAKAVGGAVLENGRARYQIPASEWIGKEVQIAVKVVGANGRDAGWSNNVAVTVAPAPDQPLDLVAVSDPKGVHLSWHAAGNAFLVFRRGPEELREKDSAVVGNSDKPEYTDATAEFGKTYRYVVQSVAKAGKGQVESDLSSEKEITPVDTFPPAVPVGLTAVPSTASIELVWERNAEPTLAGYRIYRALGSGPFERLVDTQELPTFSDRKIESGKVYRYAVSAVKRNGFESKLSAPVEAAAP